MATYNLVNSVKGGCGKTTFSIWMAYYLNRLSEEDYRNAPTETKEKYEMGVDTAILFDMDMLGTSMRVTFGEKAGTSDIAVTNDIFHGAKNSKRQFVDKIILTSGTCINIIFASMDYREREKFKSGRHAGYTPVIKHGMFRSGLRELIKDNKTIDGKDVKHFIFDMPPNSDGFSDAVMECVFDRKYSVLGTDDRKNLFMLIGSDWGQTIATIAELKMLLTHSDGILPNRVFLVLNHNTHGNFGDDCYRIRKAAIERELRKLKLCEEELMRFFFLKMYHSEKYTELGIGKEHGGLGLIDASMGDITKAFPTTVITAFAQFGHAFENVLDDDSGKKKLRNLILGEDNEQ